MVKFAKCGYGSDGRGIGKTPDGYTYAVNDNVAKGARIQVIATATRPFAGTRVKTGKKFATTAVTRHVYKQDSIKGQEARRQAMQRTGEEPTRAYTGKEVGASGSRQPIMGKDGKQRPSEYSMQARAGNIGAYQRQNPSAQFTYGAKQTYANYSKQFMKKRS